VLIPYKKHHLIPHFCAASRTDTSPSGASLGPSTTIGRFPIAGAPPEDASAIAEAQSEDPAIMYILPVIAATQDPLR
jgi:hypothetical protein